MSSRSTPTNPPAGALERSALGRLGALAFRRRRLVVVAWIAGLVVAGMLASNIGGEYTADYSTPGSESKAAAQTLDERFPGQSNSTVDVVWQAQNVNSPELRERMNAFLWEAEKLEGIGDGPGASSAEVSRNGEVAMLRLPLTTDNADEVPDATGERLLELADEAMYRAKAGGERVAVGAPDARPPEGGGV